MAPIENLHIQHLMDGRGGLYLCKPHVSIGIPETDQKWRDTGVKRDKEGTKVPHFPSENAMKKAQAKTAKKPKPTSNLPFILVENANKKSQENDVHLKQ